jgi:hypothetical protein
MDMSSQHHRRAFLASMAVGGAAIAAAGASAPAKRVLLAGRKSALAEALAAGLGAGYEVGRGEEVTRGTAAVVVLPGEPGEMADQIDRATRGVYDLLQATVGVGVGQVVYLSTLGMMAAYGDRLQADEEFAPRPDDATGLPEFLGEFVCREFAREGKLAAVVLRLAAGLDPRDAAEAVRLALDAQLAGAVPRLGTWSILHIAPGARKAQKWLGFQARFGGPSR